MSTFIIILLLVFMGAFCAAAVIANKGRHDFDARERAAEAAAGTVKETTHEQIQAIPAPALVALDPDPAARRADVDSITERFRKRLRDRSIGIVSGNNRD
jgi:hypothetical protein